MRTAGLLAVAAFGAPGGATAQEMPDSVITTVIAEGLQTVWAMAEAPDGRLFVTEREGRVRTIVRDQLAPEPWAELTVHEVVGDEAGLMGIAIDPDFASNGFVYLCYSTRAAPRAVTNRVVRMRDIGGVGSGETVLIDSMPGGSYHNGCALAFGPDGRLYVSTGDSYNRSTPQDLASAGGKILRIDPDGGFPSDNPFPNSPVWALGLRNPQGLGWDPSTGLMFVTDHGTNGIDEINVVTRGGNYGYPEVSTEHQVPEFAPPLLVHDVPPGELTFVTDDRYPELDGNLIFAGLGDGSLTRVVLTGGADPRVLRIQPLLGSEFGRIRTVIQAADGFLYFATSNHDGRGNPAATDDRVLRIRSFVY